MKKHTIYSKITHNSKLRMVFVAFSLFSLGVLVGTYLPQQKSDIFFPEHIEDRFNESPPATSSLTKLDPSKKIVANNTEYRITFDLDGNNQVHSIEIPQNWVLLPTDPKKRYIPYSKGTDYTFAFSNGAVIELIRAPTVFRFIDYSNQYMEWNKREYAMERSFSGASSIVTSKFNWSKLQYESKTINEDKSNTVGNTYYGFVLIPSIGPSQNIVIAVSAPADIENVEESIQFILNSLR